MSLPGPMFLLRGSVRDDVCDRDLPSLVHLMSVSAVGICILLECILYLFITDRIRNMGEGNVFTGVCLFTGEGSALGGGEGLFWEGVRMGGGSLCRTPAPSEGRTQPRLRSIRSRNAYLFTYANYWREKSQLRLLYRNWSTK